MIMPISKQQFIQRVRQLPPGVPSKTGRASYSGFHLQGDSLSFVRDVQHTNWRIDIGQLYVAYVQLEQINTILIRQYVKGRVYSPACAILMAMGLYNSAGRRIL